MGQEAVSDGRGALATILERIETLGPVEISALASAFMRAEASYVTAAQRAIDRDEALGPDVPGVIDTLADQLVVSAAMASATRVFGVDEETAWAATAAALDMALALGRSAAGDGHLAAGALAEPWLEIGL